jgi:hypothetical protein
MDWRPLAKCRICGSTSLKSILHLGDQALTGIFPRSRDEQVPSGPLELVRCDAAGGCGLVQLAHCFAPEQMYGQNYGYRSGLNASMVRHLHARAEHAQRLANPRGGDLVLDIGSNDSTTLRAYPTGLELAGIDPTGVKFGRYYPSHVRLIPDFFSAKLFERHFPGRRAKIITSFAMFYDLADPLDFMRQIHQVLADDGVWIFEQSYLPAMLRELSYDTICHEHLSYYALRQIKWMTDRAGFKIIDLEFNDVNGGSFCVAVAKQGSKHPVAIEPVEQALRFEEDLGLQSQAIYDEFRGRVFAHRDDLTTAVRRLRRHGKSVHGYGASTKGNVLLQFCGLGPDDLPAIAEVNDDKFGCFTPGTLIPIQSEAEVRKRRPDYLLVLPWHFRDTIVAREQAYLERGGRLLFPLPRIDIVRQRANRNQWRSPDLSSASPVGVGECK